MSTPGVARALADLPYTARASFVEAVDTIERFLVPFDAWSLMEYGLYDARESDANLASIDTAAKAEALLRLLDATISDAEDAVVPTDLDAALGQIAKMAPSLNTEQAFRQLAALSRR